MKGYGLNSMQVLSEKFGDHQFAKITTTCMDCGEDFMMNLERIGPDKIDIKNGAVYDTKGEIEFKCQACFERNPNHGPRVDVYSRVVGYLRPLSHWNNAKQNEHKMRKFYKNDSLTG